MSAPAITAATVLELIIWSLLGWDVAASIRNLSEDEMPVDGTGISRFGASRQDGRLIGSSEPGPSGVCIAVQVPLATSLNDWPS